MIKIGFKMFFCAFFLVFNKLVSALEAEK
jgi:hypothetical protein